MTTVHVPILGIPIVDSMLEVFRPLTEPHWMVDFTLGGGGHTAELLKALPRHHKIFALDQDEEAIREASERFAPELKAGRLHLWHGPFSQAMSQFLTSRPNGGPIAGMLADLGFSSDQLDRRQRGLSFQKNEPLDMRMDLSQGVTCAHWIRTQSEKEIERVLREFGEERFSRRIAATLVALRREGQSPNTTQDLVAAIVRSVPSSARHGRIHVATRTFQAFRIAINDELNELDRLLEAAILNLRPLGRFAVMSFHSLEDRKVKIRFRADDVKALTKKPIEPDESEMKANPRARSAKLRIAERR